VTRNVAGELDLPGLGETPDDLLGLSAFEKDGVGIVVMGVGRSHVGHLGHFRPMRALRLCVPKRELVFDLAGVGDNEAHRLSGPYLERRRIEADVPGLDANRSIGVGGLAGRTEPEGCGWCVAIVSWRCIVSCPIIESARAAVTVAAATSAERAPAAAIEPLPEKSGVGIGCSFRIGS
jgi:hypothetical protein